MRKIIWIVLLAFLMQDAKAQEAEEVYSFALVKKSPEWYYKQIDAWNAVIQKDSSNGLAWYYLYYASRNASRTDPNDTRPDSAKHAALEELVTAMGKAIPNSYEYNLVMYMNHGNDQNYLSYLNRAIDLGEGRIEHIDFLIHKGELERNLKLRNESCIRKWKAGLISPGMAYYNHNVLAGLDQNAILLTAGDNDTYPAWFVQAQGYRPDVTVINLSLILIDDYRRRLSKELGLDSELTIDWNATPGEPGHIHRFYQRLLPALIKNSKGSKVYVGLTAISVKDLIKDFEDHLYLTGLVYEYSQDPIDEKALLKKNFEQTYTLDYILNVYYPDLSKELVKVINQNYLVPMLKLYDHYKLAGDITRCQWLKTYLIRISEGTESEEEVKKHL